MPSFRAELLDGTTVIEENLYERSDNFLVVLEANKAGLLKDFRVFLDDGSVFGVNLMTGALETDGTLHTPDPIPSTPLRIIYYKTMRASLGEGGSPTTIMHCVTVGWQTTTEDGKNAKVGIKVYPQVSHYEITEGV